MPRPRMGGDELSHALNVVPMPAPRASVLFPPNRDHEFFALADAVPFAHADTAFSWANAWWLAEAALLAYDDPANVCRAFARGGFEVCGGAPLTAGAVQCYVVRNDAAVIVAFRGTEVVHRDSERGYIAKSVDVVSDIVTNMKVAPHELEGGAWVHEGFHAALEGILEPQLRPVLQSVRGHRSLWLTGHSLGGALAAVGCHYLSHVRGAYTFGAPRVGDARFVQSLQTPLWRLVNNADLVTRVPPARPDPALTWLTAGYAHAGTAVHLDGDAVRFDVSDEAEPPALLSDAVAMVSTPSRAWRRLREQLTRSLTGAGDLSELVASLRPGDGVREVMQGLVDHAPLYYALKTRNALIRSLEQAGNARREDG